MLAAFGFAAFQREYNIFILRSVPMLEKHIFYMHQIDIPCWILRREDVRINIVQ